MFFNKFKRTKIILIAILLLAAVLRLVNLTQADVITDEALNAIRSIGLIDYDAAALQTSPWQWFETVPGWAKLSFHDHPILTFAIEHFFFNIFGVSLFVLRLPFILAGILSVYLIYLIGKRLFNEVTGIWAAFLMSILSYQVWISRIGLQESLVILLMLVTFYLFLISLNNKKLWYWWGAALGLAFLAKYVSFILLPICLSYLIIFRRNVFRLPQFWLGLTITFLIFSPSIIYNLALYQARGHFDFQLSYLLGQTVSEWPVFQGREQSGGVLDHARLLLPKLKQGLSWPAFILLLCGFLSGGFGAFKNKSRAIAIIFISSLLFFLWLIVIGSEQRFMTYVVPFLILSLASLIVWSLEKKKKITVGVLVIWLAFEIFFSINSVIAYQPQGPQGITWSPVYYEVKSWGFNELDDYLKKLLDSSIPALALPARYQFLEDIKKEYLQKNKTKETKPYLVVYDASMDDLGALWVIHRRVIYQAWPILDAETYSQILADQGSNFFHQQGVKEIYFIKATDKVLLENNQAAREAADKLEAQMKPESLASEIKNKRGEVVFRVYRFD